jgi:thiol-disulfide isomerase/thioredoxin
MKRFLLLITAAFLIQHQLAAQSISGHLSLGSGQAIQLEGFNGLETYPIASTIIDDKGHFKLHYTKVDQGVAYLMSAEEKPFIVILSGENIEVEGEALSNTASLKITEGQENKWLEQYAQEHPRREQALSAWMYLEQTYAIDPLFSGQQTPRLAILKEKQRIKAEDAAFLNSLPKDSYVHWFLPVRKLVSSVAVVAQYRTEEIPATIAAFRRMDYTDARLYKSGLFRDAMESHFWLLENSGKSLDSVYIEMETSIDAMLQKLVKDEQKLNEVTDHLFDYLERHSLFQASEYLALKVLNEGRCTIDSDLAKQLETYRVMKKGNIAPDIHFEGENSAPGYTANHFPEKLSAIQSSYTLVVFGASWCPKCTEEIPEIARLYEKWQSQGMEVVLVSLDQNKESYHNFVKGFPFISTCDFQQWDSKIVKDYYVFGTPTMYLLNAKREILLRPVSVKQIDAWVDALPQPRSK